MAIENVQKEVDVFLALLIVLIALLAISIASGKKG
jgi:hypothetical protein